MQPKNPRPLFDPIPHEYRDPDNRETLESVTQILKKAGHALYGGVDQAILQRASQFGRHFHAATVLDDRNDLDEESCEPSLLGCIEGWRRFKREFQPEIVLTEERLQSRKFKFAGTLDRLLRIKDNFILPDFKTGAAEPWHGFQTAGYDLLVLENYLFRIKERWGVYFNYKKPGTYSIIHYRDRNDHHKFLKALFMTEEINHAHAID